MTRLLDAVADAVAGAPWAALLPSHRSDGGDQPVGAPAVLDALRLAEDRWLVVAGDDRGRTYPVPLVSSSTGVHRARVGDGAGEALLALLAAGTRDEGRFSLTSFHSEPAVGEQSIDVDQTNESLVVGRRAVLKWSFLAEAGPHPAPRVLAELASRGFTGTPRPWGLVQWTPSDGEAPRLVASVVALVPGAVDGWTWAVEDLRHTVATGDLGTAAWTGARVGELVARFHEAMAATVRTAPPEEARHWRSEAEADLEEALSATSGESHRLLAASAPGVRRSFADIRTTPTPVLRVHGDLHVGQVLRSDAGEATTYVVTDFDGNPVVPPADRLREQPAAADVAGMLQSMRHAALVLHHHEPHLPARTIHHATSVVCEAFLTSYRDTMATAGHSALLDDRLLTPFALRQVCREFTYAARHLPRWSYVPQAALPQLLAAGEVR